MSRLFKTWLLWMLVAALPLQGWAAVAKMSCATDHQVAQPIVSTTAIDHSMHGMNVDNADRQHHDHHAMTTAAQTDESVGDHSMSHHDSAQHHSSSSACSACASCCLGTIAAMSMTVLTPAYESASLSFIAPPSPPASFVPAGLERPPKTISI